MFLTAIMIGCMVIVCNLLSQLEDAEEKKGARNNVNPSIDGQQQQPQDRESADERNQMAPRPAVIRQSWIDSGNLSLF